MEDDEDERETLRHFNSFAIFEGGGGEIYPWLPLL